MITAETDAGVDLHFWIVRAMARRAGVSLSDAMYEDRLTREGFARMVARCAGCGAVRQCLAHLGDPRAPGAALRACPIGADLRALAGRPN